MSMSLKKWSRWILSLALAVGVSGCCCLRECDPGGEEPNHDARPTGVSGIGMFKTSGLQGGPVAQFRLTGASGADVPSLVQVFGAPGLVHAGPLDTPERYIGSIANPPSNWSLLTPVAMDDGNGEYTLLLRSYFTGSPTKRDYVGTFSSYTAATPIGMSRFGAAGTGVQITVSQCTGTFYTTGVALYDMEISYNHVTNANGSFARPRVIRVYTAPAGTSPFPTAAHLIHSQTVLPDAPPGGSATWTYTGLSGPYDGSSSAWWITFEEVWAAGGPATAQIPGSFTGIVATAPVTMLP